MIYLIDDKKDRQSKDYSWGEDKFSNYNQVLIPIYTYDQINVAGTREKIFEDGNIILFHESFFEIAQNVHDKDSIQIRNNLTKLANEGRILLAIFSGSKSTRSISGNTAHLPVSVLYKNLEDFLIKTIENEKNLKYLLFGSKNSEIEEILLEDLKKANNNFDITTLHSESLSFLALNDNRQAIPLQLENCDSKELFIDEHFSKQSIHSYLNFISLDWFSKKQYGKIFIPLCFGPTLSDYNGLKLAIHLRCTDTINRLSPIFIYSFVPIEFILSNEHFNILKTKNIFFINYNKEEFLNALNNEVDSFCLNELPKEMLKLKLDSPKDNHSIANEWAIYRWAKTINTSDTSIENIIRKIQEDAYFKYLKTIHPIALEQTIEKNDLKLKIDKKPKILYIDDEADLGWYEVFCGIFYDVNNLNFEYLGDELKKKSTDEIINLSISKINEYDPDIVILDFRLQEIDFSDFKINDKTSIRILKKIKNEINFGIQVIMFSATNKIWNLKAMHDAGADGFISKESPENSVDEEFTLQSISTFISEIQKSVNRIFLKNLFVIYSKIQVALNKINTEDDTDFDLFIMLLKKQLHTIVESSKKIELSAPSTLDIVFLSCYNFLELFKNEYYIKNENYNYLIGIEQLEMSRYSPIPNGAAINNGKFIPNSNSDKPSWFHCITSIVIDYFNICKCNDKLIEQINSLKDARNDFIHSKKLHFDQTELTLIAELIETISKNIKE